jgi:translation initiation factor IF-2
MSDQNGSDKTVTIERKRTLSLKGGTSGGSVRQSFSHGRSKTVVVEKKKRRLVAPGTEPVAAPVAAPEPAPVVAKKAPTPTRPAPVVDEGNLSNQEMDARSRALAQAKVREVEDQKKRIVEEERQAEESARRAVEEAEAARIVAEEEAKQAQLDEQKQREKERQENREVAKRVAEGGAEVDPAALPDPARLEEKTRRTNPAEEARDTKGVRRPNKPAEERPVKKHGERRRGKLTLSNALASDEERNRSLASIKRRREREKQRSQQSGPREKISREVVLPETISIQELANRMSERSVDVIKLLMKQGSMLEINDVIDADTAELVAEELGHTVKRVSEADVEHGIFDIADEDDNLVSRPPVVTIMGHVDHGKTSLLDAIRKANVVSGEAGGITQHIGAYQVEQDGQTVTFIDTPGHAAFTAMRARGAKSTDIVVLVVAADDSVMPQTIEAINHAKAANAPIIVAINKIDRPDADPNKVRQELLQNEVFVESLGGEILDVEVSALKQTNLDKLLEAILLQAEILDLKANPNRTAEGSVIEAQLDRGRGSVATVLVQRGTLRVGDILVAGPEWARVRALIDDQGNQIQVALPSKPVEVLGFQGTPSAGDPFAVVEDEARAREIAEYRLRQLREMSSVRASGARGSLEQMMTRLQSDGLQEFPLLIKGDVQGSVEAIIGALQNLGTDEVAARVVHSGVGGITESDITLAEASDSVVIGFNIRANKQARELAQQQGREIRYYNIIYDLVDDVKAAMSGMLSPERRETFIGNAEILEVFNITKVGRVAGCRVTEGTVERGAGVRLIRDEVVIHEGTLSTLKRFKDEVKSVTSGQECGMAFEGYQDMRAGDVIECYRVEEVERTL